MQCYVGVRTIFTIARSAEMTHNHANYQDRLAFIQRLLVDQLGLSGKVSNQQVTLKQSDISSTPLYRPPTQRSLLNPTNPPILYPAIPSNSG